MPPVAGDLVIQLSRKRSVTRSFRWGRRYLHLRKRPKRRFPMFKARRRGPAGGTSSQQIPARKTVPHHNHRRLRMVRRNPKPPSHGKIAKKLFRRQQRQNPRLRMNDRGLPLKTALPRIPAISALLNRSGNFGHKSARETPQPRLPWQNCI